MADKETKESLEEKSELYKRNIEDWLLYGLIWKSGRPLIKYSLKQNPRESNPNHKARVEDGYVFNYGKTVVDIYSFYMHEKEITYTLPGLEEDDAFKAFWYDCDLNNTDYRVFMTAAQKLSSVFGSIGILVNKPGQGRETREEEAEDNIYPYYSLYTLPNIYDWEWKRDPRTHRKYLSYLKLKESNGRYLLWYPDYWEQYGIDEKTKRVELTDHGQNMLGEIPFVWMPNIKDLEHWEIGSSDIVDIAHIVVSIAQNLSTGEETMKLAGFPIMRVPEETSAFSLDDDDDGSNTEATGPRAVKQFNPEFGKDGKPDWMPTPIYEPIQATLDWIERKTDEIYRKAHLIGVPGQRKSENRASGLALRYELSQLSSVLNAKSANQIEAEQEAMRLWLKWQGQEDLMEDIEMKRSKEFSIDELAVTLDNAITAYNRVMSKRFRELVQKRIADNVLPETSAEDKSAIYDEIESNTPKESELIEGATISKNVRNAVQARADHSRDDL